MRRTLIEAALLVLLVPLLSLPQPPPAPAPSPPPAPEGGEVQAVIGEVNAFYAAYWKAWDNHDANAIGAALADDFQNLAPGPPAGGVGPQGVVQSDKTHALADIRRFFEAVGNRNAIWTRSLLAAVPSSPTEAMVAVRNDFALADVARETELTLEVVRKGADGRWRLVRKWSEHRAF